MLKRGRVVDVVLVAAGVLVVAAGIGFRLADLRTQTVLSGSMQPAMSPGDLAITRPVPLSSLRVGDAIAFVPPGQTTPVLHRLVAINGNAITSKGDANAVVDPWHAILTGTTAYRLIFVVPFIGWLTEIRGPALIAAALIVLLVILVEVRKEVMSRNKPSMA